MVIRTDPLHPPLPETTQGERKEEKGNKWGYGKVKKPVGSTSGYGSIDNDRGCLRRPHAVVWEAWVLWVGPLPALVNGGMVGRSPACCTSAAVGSITQPCSGDAPEPVGAVRRARAPGAGGVVQCVGDTWHARVSVPAWRTLSAGDVSVTTSAGATCAVGRSVA
ncbi:hypothetical protein BKA93DRAFT_754152 [Sparassis latifolia]